MKEFSAETREKLSVAMKRRWARVRAEKEAEAARIEEIAEQGKQRTLSQLVEAALNLGCDHEIVKGSIIDGVSAENLASALDNDHFGTAQRARIRKALTAQIIEAVGFVVS